MPTAGQRRRGAESFGTGPASAARGLTQAWLNRRSPFVHLLVRSGAVGCGWMRTRKARVSKGLRP